MQLFKRIVVWILMVESRLIIRKYKPFIVAVTGSVGKTSTKDAIYSVLKDTSGYVRKSDKSFNSPIGLPLTVIGVPNAWHSFSGWMDNLVAGLRLIASRKEFPDCLILEIGADHPGDITNVTKWLHPDIAVITKVSRMPVHVEFFTSPEQVLEEKAALVTAVKEGGTVVLFADDDKVAALGERVKEKNVRVLTFGIDRAATARAENYSFNLESGISFTLELVGEKMPVTIHHVIGKAFLYPALAAAAVGKARNVPLASIVRSLNNYEPPKGRLNLIKGLNGSTIIDDTYNSSPDAVLSALQALKDCGNSTSTMNSSAHQNGTRKIAILGDMMELGKYASAEHRTIGKEVAAIANILITVGPRSHLTAEDALKNGLSAENVHSFDTSVEAADFVSSIICSGDIVLVKGSQSIRMERVVKALLLEPEKADRLLVRQEKEWLLKD